MGGMGGMGGMGMMSASARMSATGAPARPGKLLAYWMEWERADAPGSADRQHEARRCASCSRASSRRDSDRRAWRRQPAAARVHAPVSRARAGRSRSRARPARRLATRRRGRRPLTPHRDRAARARGSRAVGEPRGRGAVPGHASAVLVALFEEDGETRSCSPGARRTCRRTAARCPSPAEKATPARSCAAPRCGEAGGDGLVP